MTRTLWATATTALCLPRGGRAGGTGRAGRLRERAIVQATSPSIARSHTLPGRLAAQALAGALLVARAHPGPGGQVLGRREAAHVRRRPRPRWPPPSPPRPRGWSPAASTAAQRGQRRSILLQPGDRLLQEVDVGQELAQQHPVVRLDPPVRAWRSAGSLARSRPRASSASASGSASPPSSAASIARPLTPRTSVATAASLRLAPSSVFCSRLTSLGALLHQRLAVAGQLAQLADRRRGDEAGPQQAVAQQVGQPLAVLDVRLAPRHGLDVLRVDQQQLPPLALQQVQHGAPVRPANNVAKRALEWEFSVVIPRERLRPADASVRPRPARALLPPAARCRARRVRRASWHRVRDPAPGRRAGGPGGAGGVRTQPRRVGLPGAGVHRGGAGRAAGRPPPGSSPVGWA